MRGGEPIECGCFIGNIIPIFGWAKNGISRKVISQIAK